MKKLNGHINKTPTFGQHLLSCWLMLGLTALFAAGCSRSDQAIGVPHSGAKSPIFYQGNAGEEPSSPTSTAESTTESADKLTRMPFLHSDHFGLLTIRPAGFRELESRVSKDLKLTESLEQLLAPMIGTGNSKLTTIERIWLLLDRDGFDLMGIDQMPVLWIVDFRDSAAWDPSDIPLGRVTQPAVTPGSANNSAPSTSELPVELGYKILGSYRLALGSPAQLAKLETLNRPQASLVERLHFINEDSEISGLLVVEPIQRTLDQTLGLLARFGDQARSIANLPEQIRSVSFQFSVSEPTTISASVEAKDEKNADDLFLMISGLIAMLENLDSLNGLASQSNFPSSDLDSPIEMRVTEVLEQISSEIKTKSLTQIDQSGPMLQISLQRPSQLDPLVQAISEDFLASQFLESRWQKLEQLAQGLAEYEKTHGHLPPLIGEPNSKKSEGGTQEETEKKTGQPFNWRVAILPLIGEQELYDQFDFTERWDSPKNLMVAKRIPETFAVIGDEDLRNPLTLSVGSDHTPIPATRWHAVFGPSAIYRSERNQPGLADIEDQKIRTALILEGDPGSAVPWTAPTVFDLQAWPVERFGIPWENGVLLIDANFKTRLLKKDRDFLKIMLDSGTNPALPRNAFFR